MKRKALLLGPSLLVLGVIVAFTLAKGGDAAPPAPPKKPTIPKVLWGKVKHDNRHHCTREHPCTAVVVLGPSSSPTRQVVITSHQERLRNAMAAVVVNGQQVPARPAGGCGAHFEDQPNGVTVTASSCETDITLRVALVNTAPEPRVVAVFYIETVRLPPEKT